MSKEIISKELLSEITGCKVIEIYGVFDENELQFSCKYESHTFAYNIHELAHKCKEWAFNLGFTIEIELRHNSYPIEKTKCIVRLGKYGCKGVAGTEIEAIFKSCQWILENEQTK